MARILVLFASSYGLRRSRGIRRRLRSVRAQLQAKIGALLVETHWSPTYVASFAGALPYTKYDRLTRAVMQFISTRAGHPTDASRDYEFTDWAKVAAFADTIASDLRQAPASATASPARASVAPGHRLL